MNHRSSAGLVVDMLASLVVLAAALSFLVPLPVTLSIPPATMQRGEGLAWLAELPVKRPGLDLLEGDTMEQPTRSSAVVLEDGRTLGPGHAIHEEIRREGKGRFSHWGRGLYFSTSDASDPRSNGRRYLLRTGAMVEPWLSTLLLAAGGIPLLVRLCLLAWRSDAGMRALGRIAVAAAPVLLIAVGVLALFRLHGGDRLFVRPPAPEYAMLDTQMARVKSVPVPDIAFVGDSSCLMGIDAPAIARRLGVRVENFCTLGFVGPVGYAHMVDELRERAPDTAELVVMIHAVQLARNPSWDSWAEYVATDGASARRPASFLTGARVLVQEALDPVVFRVLPGSYGRRYASEHAVARAVEKGEIVDPTDRALDTHFPASAPAVGLSYEPSAAFLAAAPTLGEAIRRFDRRTYLVVSPDAAHMEDAALRAERDRATRELARLFAIPPERILRTPASLPSDQFAVFTHLGLRGRETYSAMLSQALGEARARP